MSAVCQVTGRTPGFGKQVSTKGMRVIDRRGIESVVAELRAKGQRI
jgi:ribosomal protein L28